MPKLKTRKAVLKRFKISAKKKVSKRALGQNHFNARQTTKRKRQKRSDTIVLGKDAKNVLKEILKA